VLICILSAERLAHQPPQAHVELLKSQGSRAQRLVACNRVLGGVGACDCQSSQTAFLKNAEKAQHGDQNGDQNTSNDKKNKPAVANQPCDKANFISQGFQFGLEFFNSRLS
jgi:hypothetical protein